MSSSRVPVASHRSSTHAPSTRRRRRCGILAGLASGGIAGAVALLMVAGPQPAYAAEPTVGLGTADAFAVLAGTTVTNTGATVVTGDLGVSPGTAITGFPPGQVTGTQHPADAVALQAQNDLTTAYNSAAGRPATAVATELGGRTLVGGVYRSAAAMTLTGTVTLDAQGDPDTVFVFQAGSTLTTASNSTVALVNGAQACNVFWQVGSSATLGTNTTFYGTIMALTTVTLQTGTTVVGRVLARNGAVNLDDNTITRPGCVTGPTATTSGPTATTSGPTATATTGGPTTSAPTATTSGPTATATTSATTGGPTTSAPTATTSGPTATATTGGPTDPTGTESPTPSATVTGSPTWSPSDPSSGEMPGASAGGPPAAGSHLDHAVPVGHPDTGRDGAALHAASSSGLVWFALALVALLGSGLAGARLWSMTRVAPSTA